MKKIKVSENIQVKTDKGLIELESGDSIKIMNENFDSNPRTMKAIEKIINDDFAGSLWKLCIVKGYAQYMSNQDWNSLVDGLGALEEVIETNDIKL